MLLPLLLSFLATLAAGWMAYGTDPRWVQHPWGLGLILLSRRLQWPLVAVALILCLVLLALVISGKRRVWWLIGLAPVLAMFGHRFVTGPGNQYDIADEPAFVAAGETAQLRDEDWVVGVVFNGQPYAYPFGTLFRTPVVVQSDREHRMLLVWSPYANAATALAVSRELKARDLDVVCDPADSLLLYNSRTGQFIVGLTGNTPAGVRPENVNATLATTKQSWRHWRAEHPDTRVMLAAKPHGGPRTPVLPRLAAAPAGVPAKTPVVLLGNARPAAVRADDISAAPLNVAAGDVPVVVFRDRASGQARAFDRRIEKDLIPRFALAKDARQREKGIVLVDSDTGTGWNAAGVAIDGAKEWRGRKLVPVEVREDVAWGPAKFWYPQLELSSPAPSTRGSTTRSSALVVPGPRGRT